MALDNGLHFEHAEVSPFLDERAEAQRQTEPLEVWEAVEGPFVATYGAIQDVEAELDMQVEEVDLEEAEPARWTGTPDQLAFRDRVLQAHLDASRKRIGAPIADLTDADLAPVRGTPVRMRKDAAAAADRLLSAALAALAEAQRAGHPDAVKTRGISASSGYRSRMHQERLWKGYFDGIRRKPKGYFDETALARSRLPGGPLGERAADYMLSVFRIPDRIAAPGYSNHQAGLAIDLVQKRVKGEPVFNSTSKRWVRNWESTWLFEWLLANAGSVGFERYSKEPWHWTYRPAGGERLELEGWADLAQMSSCGPVAYAEALDGDVAEGLPSAQLTEYEVIPPDERVRIHDTLAVPYRWICSLDVTRNDGSLFRGSGILIGPRQVLTAAHNIYDMRGEVPDSVYVAPARNGPDLPFGRFKAVAYTAINRYLTAPTPGNRFDLAMVTLERNAAAIRAKALGGDQLGYWGDPVTGHRTDLRPLETGFLAGKPVIVCGYPGDKCDGAPCDPANRSKETQANTMWSHFGPASFIGRLPGLVLYTADTSPGQSGSAVWIKFSDGRRSLVGVHVARRHRMYNPTTRRVIVTPNRGVHLCREAVRLVQSWLGS